MIGYDILIIGGGASGLSAGAAIAMSGLAAQRKVAVVEQGPRMGRKLLATGNGRCNLYNTDEDPGHFVSGESEILSQALKAVRAADQPGFWRQLGLPVYSEENGLVYPRCEQAAAVVEMLTSVCEEGGITLLCDSPVKDIRKDRAFRVRLEDGTQLRAEKVILAAGGKAAPNLSTDGAGYPLARKLGHTVTALRPGLVPVTCRNPSKTMKGVRAKCRVTLMEDGAERSTLDGEVQFTEYGVSGIVIMQHSLRMEPDSAYAFRLDLLPGYTGEELLSLLKAKRDGHPNQKAAYLLQGFVKNQMCELLLRSCRVDCKKRTLGSLTDGELEQVCARVKGWTVQADGLLDWEHAQVTRGGVPLDEIDPQTFESRKTPGLYLTGELLDAAGECGGFNLTWAFGSGICAGRNAAEIL